MHIAPRVLAVAVVAALLSSPSQAAVDVEIDTNAKISSELAEAEVETFRFRASRGSVLTLSLAAKKKAPLDFVVTLAEDGVGDLDLTTAKKFRDTDKKFQVKGLTLGVSADYVLTVASATGSGAYALKLKVVAQKKWPDVTTLGANGTNAFAFAAPAGSAVTLKAKAAKGSTADPRFGDLDGNDLSTEGKSKTGAHTVKTTTPDESGEVTVDVTDIGGTGGDVVVSASVRAPKVKTQKLDARSGSLGSAVGEESLVARTIKAGDGGSVVVADGKGIDGAGVLIDPGALDSDTRITVSSVAPPGGVPAQRQAGGPAVQFGPSGIDFATPATVTVPYDEDMLAADADEMTDLSVLRVQADGTVTENPVSSVNATDDTVTTETDGFSTFMVIGPQGTPRIEGNAYWYTYVGFDIESVGVGMDSRDRSVEFGFGSAAFVGPKDTADGFAVTADDRSFHWTHDDSGEATITGGVSAGSDTGTWTYGTDGRSIEVSVGGDPDASVFALSRDGRFLGSLDADAPGETSAELAMFVKKPAAALTTAQVAGTYWFGGIDCGVAEDGPGNPIRMEYQDGFGTVTIRADGTVRTDLTFFTTELRGPGGTQSSSVERDRSSGTWTFDTQPGPLSGSLRLQFVDGQRTTNIRVLPCSDRHVMLGIEEDFDPGDPGFLVFALVRQASGLNANDLNGEYVAATLDFGPATYSVPSQVVVPDVSTLVQNGLLSFDGAGTVSLEDAVERKIDRDDTVTGGVRVDQFGPLDAGSLEFTLTRSGKFSGRDPGPDESGFVGAVSQDRAFGFLTDEPNDRVEFAVLTILFELPLQRD